MLSHVVCLDCFLPTPLLWWTILMLQINGYTEIVKLLFHLTDNPYAPNKDGSTPVSIAVHYGYTEILKILAPLTNNPNAHGSD